MAVASVDGVAATALRSEGPVPCRRLGAMVRATRLLVAHKAEAAAGDQRERLRVVWGFAHQLIKDVEHSARCLWAREPTRDRMRSGS
jgi:hypothetical protein